MTDGRITAGELRAMGVTGIPDKVPDCAWVPRSSLEWKPGQVSADGDTLTMGMTLTIHAAFQWVELNMTIERQAGAEGGV